MDLKVPIKCPSSEETDEKVYDTDISYELVTTGYVVLVREEL